MNTKFNSKAFAQAFAKAMDVALGTKAPANTPSAVGWIHGPGGIFGIAGLDQDVVSARITPRGISQVLPVFPDQYTHPEFAYITGIEESGEEPATECATCPSGETEGCIQTAQFGFVCRETKTLTPNRAIERINSGEVDLALVNDILGRDDFFQPIQSYDQGTVMQIATIWAMLEVGMLLQNQFVPMVWQGNPANNIGTGYAEFPGLDLLIGTGKQDAHTGTLCPALDSDVKEFGYAAVNSTDGSGNFNVVRQLSYLEAYLYHNADRQNLIPATWAIAMRPELWYELTEIWPVAYLTTRNVTIPGGNTMMLDASRVNDMRDDMRSGMYLFLNGRKHTVILDDGIYECTNANDANVPAGSYASNIYLVPLTYMGGRPATLFQHKDYRSARVEIAASHQGDVMWTDAGRFLWAAERIKWCYTLSGKMEPRIVLKTPQIAGRLDHVMYTPLQHFRSPFQDSDYFYKGGVAERPGPSLYSEWNQRQG